MSGTDTVVFGNEIMDENSKISIFVGILPKHSIYEVA